ncbi:MAG: hypothetical protein BEN18_07795 [Epulopiscium sp. Nuni2H_MBin001]|nr:MAG: hypothetical protein BEN18_07795 [Epulopiscium sp. Nuni2H_MBin001]
MKYKQLYIPLTALSMALTACAIPIDDTPFRSNNMEPLHVNKTPDLPLVPPNVDGIPHDIATNRPPHMLPFTIPEPPIINPVSLEAADGFTDRAGRAIIKLDEYNRIVSYSPAFTEILVDLGLGDKVVATSTYDFTRGIPRNVTVFDTMNPSVEDVAAVDPDLIIASPLAGEALIGLNSSNITVATVPTANKIADIYDDLDFMGELLNKQDKTDELKQHMQDVIHDYIVAAADIEDKRTVYFEVAPAPNMYATGADTFLNEMIEYVGGINVIAMPSWVRVTDHMIVAANPDVILTNSNYKDYPYLDIMKRNGWHNITAVDEYQVYQVDHPSTSLANHNIVNGMVEIARSIYPEFY